LRLTKYTGLLYSVLICLAIGIWINIWSIAAEEYSNFDNSLEATNKALILQKIDNFYFPSILVIHLMIFLIFKHKDAKRK
jgi:hypothetical protein